MDSTLFTASDEANKACDLRTEKNLLPLWRFRTVSIAQKSAAELREKFKEFDEQDDFVGMDMAPKSV
ncbi:hypothetical protein F4824DRAFT_503017 [Ustulina deusta]|nr:hypothetical protein F4824DRAFT_503017 [Ustulina deusta]